MARFNYVELPVADTAASKAFYRAAFDFSFTDFGPTYSATTTGDTDVGFQADDSQKTKSLLPVIEVADLGSALAAVKKAGGKITQEIFAFPGGHRFYFRDPDGHEIGVVKLEHA
jgi:predicted enzyme related to lactoylglutathione lyase